MVCNRKFR